MFSYVLIVVKEKGENDSLKKFVTNCCQFQPLCFLIFLVTEGNLWYRSCAVKVL